MNLKKAKKLRRAARAMTEGKPEREYVKTPKGPLVVANNTTRGMYLALKKMYGS